MTSDTPLAPGLGTKLTPAGERLQEAVDRLLPAIDAAGPEAVAEGLEQAADVLRGLELGEAIAPVFDALAEVAIAVALVQKEAQSHG